jgi:hypothetical protein
MGQQTSKIGRWTARTLVGVPLVGSLAMSLFPPFYLSAAGQRMPILGVPAAILYMIVSAFLIGLSVAIAYWVEYGRTEQEG